MPIDNAYKEYPGGWFGKDWGAPICAEEGHKPTPVDELCVDCKKRIGTDDQGLLVPNARRELAAIHIDCLLRDMHLGAT